MRKPRKFLSEEFICELRRRKELWRECGLTISTENWMRRFNKAEIDNPKLHKFAELSGFKGRMFE